MTTITLDIAQTSSSSAAASVDASRLSPFDATDLPTGLQGKVSRGIPALSDPEQAYFWSADWQAAERAADADLSEGRFRDFDDIEDAVRWLLADY